jgi:hypothetical protein
MTVLARVLVVSSAILGASITGAAAASFTKVVDTHTLIPRGGGATFGLSNTSVPAVSGDRLVFLSTNPGGTIWTVGSNGRGFKKVIGPRTRIPPGGFGRFQQFFGDYAAIHQDTVVLVGDACGGCGAGVGIYTVPALGGAVTSLVDIKAVRPDSAPGEPEKFSDFPADFATDGLFVAFQNGGRIYKVPLAGGRVSTVAAFHPPPDPPSPPSPWCCIFNSPTITGSTVLLRAGNVFGNGSIQTAHRTGSPFQVVANGPVGDGSVIPGMHPPDTPPGHRFDPFEFALPVIDRAFVFRGASCDPDACNTNYITGIYSFGNSQIKLVDTNTPVPGGAGNFRRDSTFNFTAIAASEGNVVFRGYDAEGKVGLYTVRENGRRLRKIIAEGDPIGGFTVAPGGLAMRREGLSGTTLVFLVTYADFQGGGIYSTDLSLP